MINKSTIKLRHLLAPDYFYIILLLSWIASGYVVFFWRELFLLIFIFLRLAQIKLTRELATFVSVTLIIGSYLLLRDTLELSEIRPYIRENLLYLLIAPMFVAIPRNFWTEYIYYYTEQEKYFKYAIILCVFAVGINYFNPTLQQIDFSSSESFHGRYYIGASSNPIWTLVLSNYALAIACTGGFIRGVVFFTISILGYLISVNDAYFISLALCLIYFTVGLRAKNISVLLLLLTSVVAILVFTLIVVPWLVADASAAYRLGAFLRAFNDISLLGSSSKTFYVDLPLVELALELGVLGLALSTYIIYIFYKALLLSTREDNKYQFWLLAAGLNLGSAFIHYRPLEYTFIIPVAIAMHWVRMTNLAMAKRKNY